MENEQNYTIEDIITAIQNKEPIEVEKTFSDVLSDKLKTTLDTKKQELAKSVFSPELETDPADGAEAESDDSVETEDAVEEEADFLEKVENKKRDRSAAGKARRKQQAKDYKKLSPSKKKKRATKAKKVAKKNKGKNTVKMVGNFDPLEELDYGDDEDI